MVRATPPSLPSDRDLNTPARRAKAEGAFGCHVFYRATGSRRSLMALQEIRHVTHPSPLFLDLTRRLRYGRGTESGSTVRSCGPSASRVDACHPLRPHDD